MPRNESSDGSAKRKSLFTTGDAVARYTGRISDSELFPQERKAITRYFTDTDASVLDVGCGVGRISHLLHERGYDVTGVDVSEPMVEKARSLFPEITFRVEDIRGTSFDSKSFDYIVFSYYGLDYVLPKAERVKALREIYRLLKPAGILVFSSHNSWYVGRDVAELYLSEKNRDRIFSRRKIESVPLGEVEIYLSNPIHQWLQLRKCGFTLLDVVGKRDGFLRFFERDPHYIAKK